MADGARVVLVGMTGSGKTTTGRLLAEQLGCPHVDVDDLVAEEAGMAVAEVWARAGEPAFRVAERRAVGRALARPGSVVVSLGGGAVGDEATRRALRDDPATVVWLRAAVPTLLARLAGPEQASRPVLGDGDPAARVAELAAARAPWYREVADLVVDVDGLAAGAVADRVGAALAPVGAAGAPTSEERAR